jgi:hypothetical protein
MVPRNGTNSSHDGGTVTPPEIPVTPFATIAPCYEIVHFAFEATVPLPRQVEAMKALGDWLAAQSGFQSRKSYHDPQHARWTDLVAWISRADAVAAMDRSQHDPALAGVMSLIVPESVHAGHFERII